MNGPERLGFPESRAEGDRSLLEVSDLNVSYGRTRALIDANLIIKAGEIHAVIGENGCGKSTLVKTISGIVRPSSGTLKWKQTSTIFKGPRAAQAAGVVTVFQETLVADEMSVLDNLCLGTDGTFRHGLGRQISRLMGRKHLDELGLHEVGLDAPLWQLPLSRRHLVAIARALMRSWSLLILDEATAALDVSDSRRLFGIIRKAKTNGRSILYISHRMDEIEDLADNVTVLRSGRAVGLLARKDVTRRAMLDLMSPPTLATRALVDRKLSEISEHPSHTQDIVFRATDVKLESHAEPLNLDIVRGEVIGLAGLEGHGQVGFLRCLAGWQKPQAGRLVLMVVPDRSTEIKSSQQMLAHSVAYVPGDRKREGIFASLSVLDNLMLPSLGKFSTAGIIALSKVGQRAADLIERMKVKPPVLGATIENLSGGNQQKVVVGRWIATGASVLLLEDPMRGVDVTSKAEIVGVLSRLVDDGATLVFLSTEVEELVDICHRVVVFRDQTIFRVINRTELTTQAIVSAMLGHVDHVQSQ
jgi:ABC-type sugar transport system ATPase subunit